MSLTVCIITKNEEKFIGQCIDSISAISSEIIVVDSKSTDNTVHIALEKGAVVYTIDWINDYSFARNYAIEKAKSDWILFLDADEYLINAKKLMQEAYRKSDSNTGGFLIERLDKYRRKEDGKIEQYPIGLVRLFKNIPGIEFKGTVHEQINTTITSNGLKIKILEKSKIIHQVHKSTDDFIDHKQMYYLHLIEKELKLDPNNIWMQYQHAKTLWYLNRKQEAKTEFLSLAQNNKAGIVITCSSLCNLAILLSEEELFETALENVNKSLNINPNQSLGYLIAGNIHYKLSNYTLSVNCYKKVKTKINLLKYEEVIPGDLYVYPEEKLYRIALCYLAQGKRIAGIFLLKRALSKNKLHTSSLYTLALIEMRKKPSKALEKINLCLKLNHEWTEPQLALNKLIQHN